MTDREVADKLDETIAESFPASDAPANTVLTGIRLGPDESLDLRVRDNRAASRFEVVIDSQVAFLRYERRPEGLALIHTEVPEPLRGRGLATVLAKAGIEAARAEGRSVIAICPVVRAYLRKHPAGV